MVVGSTGLRAWRERVTVCVCVCGSMGVWVCGCVSGCVGVVCMRVWCVVWVCGVGVCEGGV